MVPYWGQQPNRGGAEGGAARTGTSYDPNGGPTGPLAGGGSALNNLSALTPILNAIIQQQQAGAMGSGQGNAMANPMAGAVSGAGSADLAPQIAAAAPPAIGSLPIAGSGVVPGLGSTPSGNVTADGSGPVGTAASGPVGTTGEGNAGLGDAAGGTAGVAGPSGAVGTSGEGNAGLGDAAAGPVGDSGGGGGAGGGAGTVICTELRRQGLMDDITWAADHQFGLAQTQTTRDGYRLWATPLARGMARSRLLTRVVAPIALRWAREMAFQMGAVKAGSILGYFIMAVGIPLCTLLGSFVSRKGVRA